MAPAYNELMIFTVTWKRPLPPCTTVSQRTQTTCVGVIIHSRLHEIEESSVKQWVITKTHSWWQCELIKINPYTRATVRAGLLTHSFIHFLTYKDKQPCKPPTTPTGNLELPINLMCMSLEHRDMHPEGSQFICPWSNVLKKFQLEKYNLGANINNTLVDQVLQNHH